MIKVETVKVENDPSRIMSLSLGVHESKMLDSLIDKLLTHPYKKDDDPNYELQMESDEYMFLTSLAARIGQSGMRQYIESEDK
jgi:hypothetical protein